MAVVVAAVARAGCVAAAVLESAVHPGRRVPAQGVWIRSGPQREPPGPPHTSNNPNTYPPAKDPHKRCRDWNLCSWLGGGAVAFAVAVFAVVVAVAQVSIRCVEVVVMEVVGCCSVGVVAVADGRCYRR